MLWPCYPGAWLQFSNEKIKEVIVVLLSNLKVGVLVLKRLNLNLRSKISLLFWVILLEHVLRLKRGSFVSKPILIKAYLVVDNRHLRLSDEADGFRLIVETNCRNVIATWNIN